MKLKIRRAIVSDCMNVFELSNDPVVRKNSINRDKIVLENHLVWFEKKIADSHCEYYIIENEFDEFVAQVRFDNTEDGTYIGISIVEKFRGRSLGSRIIELATLESSYIEILSKIRKVNIASYKAFIKAGYKYLQDDKEYYILIFTKNTGNNG